MFNLPPNAYLCLFDEIFMNSNCFWFILNGEIKLNIETSTSIQFMLDEVTNLPYVVHPSKDRLPDDAFTVEELNKLVEETFGV